MMNRKRILALALCLGITFVLAASSVFVIHEADHDCAGEECEICARIAATVHLLRSFAMIGGIRLVLFAAPLAARKCGQASGRSDCLSLTLVGCKVRLNN